ncbi:TlyA family RNA methyltransferase [Myxococcota bacterium]|nr:TlyA family RNA methyltransferase [Myxococcota bacterium]
MKSRTRADHLAVEAGLAPDVARAASLIMEGRVIALDPRGREHRVDKPGEPLRAGTTLRLKGEARTFVSRAGHKLDDALTAFGVDVTGWICADIGISTGGFTDCLLRRGAARVHGVDVGYGDVAWSIRTDARVVLHERTNARTLPPRAFGELVRLAVVDVSFITLGAVLPAIVAQLDDDGAIVALVKPQFELGREDLDGGIVRDDAARARAIAGVVEAAGALGLGLAHDAPSSTPGADGNVEHLVHLVRILR